MFKALISRRAFQTTITNFEKTLFVRNIAWGVSEQDLHSLFSQHGAVRQTRIITDRETGRSRGFAFIDMEDEGAVKAIEDLNGFELSGRPIAVTESDPNAARGPRVQSERF